jgi:hypothetical protein
MNIIPKKVPMLVALFVALSGCGTLIEAGEEAATCVFDEDCGAHILLEVLSAEEVQCGSKFCVKLDVKIQSFSEETVDISMDNWLAGSDRGSQESPTNYYGPASLSAGAVKEFSLIFPDYNGKYTTARIVQEDGENLAVGAIPEY